MLGLLKFAQRFDFLIFFQRFFKWLEAAHVKMPEESPA